MKIQAAARLKASNLLEAAPVNRKYFKGISTLLKSPIVTGGGGLYEDFIHIPKASLTKTVGKLEGAGWKEIAPPANWHLPAGSKCFQRDPEGMRFAIQPIQPRDESLYSDLDNPPAVGDYRITAPLTSKQVK
ncbi:hypothetical protein [Burkholderia phage BCSR5]|nr:hypothetical protein [Burkholderia phage BCSR5]